MTYPIWLILCRTGCTCCACENHYRGPYVTAADAERRVESFLREDSDFWPLASQYARRGVYRVEEYQVEKIDRDRVILDGRVYQAADLRFVGVAGDGSLRDIESDAEVFLKEAH